MTMTTASLTERAHNGGVPEPEDPAPRPKRRTFTAEYKARILAEHDAFPDKSPERGALVRREGLYSSHISEWRNAAARAALGGLEPKTRQPKRSAAERELDRANARISKLEVELERTRPALDITGKGVPRTREVALR
jgi:transposase